MQQEAGHFMLNSRFKTVSLVFICLCILAGGGSGTEDECVEITEITPKAPENNVTKTMDVYETIPQDIEISDFLSACLGNSVTIDMREETAEAVQFQAQIDGIEYTGHMAENNVTLRAVTPTSYDVQILPEDNIRKKCDEVVKKLSWGSAKVKKCSLEHDERGSYYLLVYEFDVEEVPIIGNIGFAIPNTGGEEFTSGEYIAIEYGTELRAVEVSNIRKILEVSDTIEIISEAEAENVIDAYFSTLEQTGIEISQTRQSMQIVYIPYPVTETDEKLIPAWMMNSITDTGEQCFTIVDAKTGYVYMNGL